MAQQSTDIRTSASVHLSHALRDLGDADALLLGISGGGPVMEIHRRILRHLMEAQREVDLTAAYLASGTRA